jgi:peptidoglycan/xylan/chitin deacetylase (PgdA/CDA1 family)/GT2 family glycosyltransferase/pyruvate-formate lyase-activating enzyme
MGMTARNVCLHYVERAPASRRLALSPEQLALLIEGERAAGRSAAALGDYRTSPAPGPRTFTVSFDDAHRSLLAHAAPVMRALDVRPTVFVPTGYVGTSDEFLTWDELRELRDLGWTIGSHSITHPRMSWRLHGEDEPSYAERLYEECARSRESLERALNIEVPLFAYPYGEAPGAAIASVRRAGYAAAFTVRDTLEWDDNPFAIPRLDGMEPTEHVAAAAGESGPTPISVIVPACDRVEILTEVVRRLAGQSYPRERYEVLVVDDGSRCDLSPALRGAPENVRRVAGPGVPGEFRAGQARQFGSQCARFSTLAFIDADVAVGEDFLWHLDWVHRRVPRAVLLAYLSGYNLHTLGQHHTLEEVRPLANVDGVLPVIADRSREPVLRECLDNLDWLDEPWRLAYTGNLSLPRSLLDEVGGFAPEFVGWGLEDIDLGYRLHRAGARWVFSRFAVGYHLVDPSDESPRNPFRRAQPTREHFGGYLANLERLRARHAGDAAMNAFYTRTLGDVDETCGRPQTVGIEMGGGCTLDCAFHRTINRCQPGGVTRDEALERVAYACKVGAREVYILGGEPAEHPGFLDVVRAAKRAGIKRVVAETNAASFSDPALAPAARCAGLDRAVVKIYGFDAECFERVTRRAGSFRRFEAGFANLAAAGIERVGRIVVTPATLASLAMTLARVRREGLPLTEVVVLDPAHVEPVETTLRWWCDAASARPSLRLARASWAVQ